jgi:hypothetical protein
VDELWLGRGSAIAGDYKEGFVMGAIAEALVAYAQPLIDQTDGSQEQLDKALAITQLCYNLALLPEEGREEAISKMEAESELDAEVFDDFRRSILLPMIRRHEEMFPLMHMRRSGIFSQAELSSLADYLFEPGTAKTVRSEAYPGTDPYAPCPCNSGEKYKFCCRKEGR